MLARRTAAPVVALAVLLSAGACGDAGRGSAGPTGPTALQPATAAPPPGTRRVTCSLVPAGGDDTPVVLALDLPAGFRDRGPCRWRRPLGFRPEAPGRPTTVTVGAVGSDTDRTAVTARELYDEKLPFAVEDGDFAGDDTTYRLRLEQDVAVFGATTGDRVSWECACDGAPYVTRVVQAAGVELTWTSVPDIVEQTDAELAATLAGAGLAPG